MAKPRIMEATLTLPLAHQLAESQARSCGWGPWQAHSQELVLEPHIVEKIQLSSGFLVLLAADSKVEIESERGVFETSLDGPNEVLHTGWVRVQNKSDSVRKVLYLRILPIPKWS